MLPTARNIPPTQPSARQDALYPGRGPSNFLYLPLGEWPRLPSTARIERHKCSLQARSLSLQGWGLIDLPLRASNEGLRRPRVARAQKIIRLHPLPCSASTGIVPATPSPLFQHPARQRLKPCATVTDLGCGSACSSAG